MNLFRALAVVLALTLGLSAVTAQASDAISNTSSGDPIYSTDSPPFYKMLGDLIIARPLLLGATVIGTAASSSACRSPPWAATSRKPARRWWWTRARPPSCAAWAAPKAATSRTDPARWYAGAPLPRGPWPVAN